MKATRTATRLVAAPIIATAMAVAPQSAAGQSAPVLEPPTITGEAVIGETLTASAQASGDPEPTLSYRWLRCGSERPRCDSITDATEPTYVVADADADHRLAVRVRAENSAGAVTERSALTAVVPAPPEPEPEPEPTPEPEPEPEPEPTPEPSPQREADRTEAPRTFVSPAPAGSSPGDAAARAERPLRYLRPFPTVRIRGTLVPGGARIDLLRIRAPWRARVFVHCAGHGCRLAARSRGGRRVRALERYLPAGTRITIRIGRRDAIGKHVTIVIRDGRAPRRRDACLLPGATVPAKCPGT